MGRTIRLFESDPYAMTFEANVIRSLTLDDRPAVVLGQTCFYPTSGGQPHDMGTLNGAAVLDVFESDDEIVHILGEPLSAGSVRGQVNCPRRRDHMQQHTGQHVLSQAFLRVCDAPTVGFHLGRDDSTIDLGIADLSADCVHRAMAEANEIVLENRPVDVAVYDDPSAVAGALRKRPTVDEAIRVVTVADYDASACCGTHVRRTGEIGAIQVTRWERSKGQVRVTFLCGRRAVADHWAKTGTCSELASLLSCGTDDLVPLVAKAIEDRKTAEKQVLALQERLAAVEAKLLRSEAEPLGAIRFAAHLFDELEPGTLRQMAREMATADNSLVAALASGAPSAILCVACGEAVPARADELLRASLTPYGGRGGGSAALAQGGGVAPERLAEAMALLRKQLAGEYDKKERP